MSVRALRRVANKGTYIEISDSEVMFAGGIARGAAGSAQVYSDNLTSGIVIGGGSALTGANAIDIDGASNAAAGVRVRAGANSDVTMGARGSTVTLNQATSTALDPLFDATSLLGSLNELKASGRFFTSVQGAGGLAPSGSPSGVIFPLNASLGNIAVTLPPNPKEGTRLGFLIQTQTGSAFDVTISRSSTQTIVNSGQDSLLSFRMGKKVGSYCELVYTNIGGVDRWVVLANTGGAYFMARLSSTAAVGGASNNLVFANTLPSSINQKITHNISTGAFTVEDAGRYMILLPFSNFSNTCDVRIQSPALLSPDPAVPSNNVFGKITQVNGIGGEMHTTGAMIELAAGGTFDVRIPSGVQGNNETYLIVAKVE